MFTAQVTYGLHECKQIVKMISDESVTNAVSRIECVNIRTQDVSFTDSLSNIYERWEIR